MRVVGLISGGKDSCFNLMHCVAEGHELVALANLRPANKDEIDSYMYQSVGHQAIDLYAEAVGLPLYRRTITGSALVTDKDYSKHPDDEVEDLFLLLQQIQKAGINFDAVSVGAILSDYQRVRVENVCRRLKLTSLAYLWRRDQRELLAKMIECKLKAIVIKVAALGLKPDVHLGRGIDEIYNHIDMSEKYGLNVCGEGGEYETFTLDCPLFKKRIIVDEVKQVLHSDDAFAPVAYLNLCKMHLEEKTVDEQFPIHDLPMRCSRDIMNELLPDQPLCPCHASTELSSVDCGGQLQATCESDALPHDSPCCTSELKWLSGVEARVHASCSLRESITSALDSLKDRLKSQHCSLTGVLAVYMYVSDIKHFAVVNDIYVNYFSASPPARVCVEAALPPEVVFRLDCVACQNKCETVRRHMHVESVSFWAPANIGPYSQAVVFGRRVYVSGQIALNPAAMTLISGAMMQSRLSLRHVGRVLAAVSNAVCLCDLLLVICYVTSREAAVTAQTEFNNVLSSCLHMSTRAARHSGRCDHSPLVGYVVVPALPRCAAIEWQVTATTDVFSWQDGEVIDDVPNLPVTVRCRWRSSGDIQAYIVSVECRQDDAASCYSLIDAVTLAIQSIHKSLSARGVSNCQDIGGLRAFARVDCFSAADLCQDFITEVDLSVIDDVTVTSLAVVPVSGFLSSSIILLLCAGA